MIPNSRAASLAALLLVAVAGGFWIHRVHIERPTAQEFRNSDIGRYLYPSSVYMHRELRRGNLSLWNPYQMAGMPFLATHISAPLYPLKVIPLALLRPARALEVQAVAHLVLAGLLMWLLARRLRLGFVASLAAAVAFMLSRELLFDLYSLGCLSTFAWLPGIIWAVHGLVSEARLRWAVALALVLVMAFLAGFAQGVLFEVQLGAVYGLAGLLFRVHSGQRVRVLGLAVASGALAFGLSAAQLLPTLELLREVPRAAEGLSLAEASRNAASPRELLEGLLGRGDGRFTCAALTLPLVLCGLADRPRRRQWLFFTFAWSGAGLFALGAQTPAFAIYHSLPGADLFRFPARIAFVWAFCASVLIGIGVEGARSWVARRRPRAPRLAAAVGLLLALGVAGDLYARSGLTLALPIISGETRGAPGALLKQLEARRDEGRVFIENFGAHYSITLPYLMGMMNEVYVVPTYEPMIPRSYTAYFGQDRLWRGFVNAVRYQGPRLHFLRVASVETFPPGGLVRLLDLMSVRFYATDARLAGRRLKELERFVGGESIALGPARLLERRRAVPRVYAVHEVIVEPDPARAGRLIQSARFNPRRQAVVERALEGIAEARGESERAEIRSYAPEEVVIDARCASECLLVLTDLEFPGWEAHVDGRPAKIHRVNTLFRGVRLPAGDHSVVYRYRPLSFRIGATLSIATLALLGAVAALALWRAAPGD